MPVRVLTASRAPVQMAKQQLVLTRGEAAYYVWRQAIGGDSKVRVRNV
jgi:hypothetical protein